MQTSSQSTTVGQEYDLYEDIRKTIEAMLTPEKGRYWLSASSSTLTVTDTPAVQEAVARYVDEQNSIMNRQVALERTGSERQQYQKRNSSVWTGTLFINRYIPPEQR
ncbi:type IVB pilus formation outer membrane protein, R64 PilN family [Escherichia coli]|uniref:Type IVB pilus formation outer membrane protein, R64 PilN family n=1 Tax=Escherichia coli TaxID=562 RepID=A0A377ECD3_ECOLX|nr:secretin N-terminal domain-containing protein [Escherichia coli]STM96294.1 type IVB pilus formation outer membrane protein, R64 PilN family [Escherichia coli]